MLGAGKNTRAVALLAALAAAVGLTTAPPAGAAATARGFDISHWNGVVDWIRAAGGGYTFVFAKATEGTTLTDPTYAINRSGAGTFGLRLGAYHFARPAGGTEAGIAASAVQQADHFVDVADPQPGDLPPALDLETTGGLAPKALTRWTQLFLDEVEARSGVKALVYASPNFWQSKLDGTTSFALAGNRLWIAHWTSHAQPTLPASGWGGQGWTFWQWTNCSTIPGFVHCADGDRFNGADVASVAIAQQAAAPPEASTPPSILGTARVGAQLAALPGTWTGGRPLDFSYQWQRCDAAGGGCVPIPGATAEAYTPGAADAGHALAVTVTGQNGVAVASSSSPATRAVAAGGGTTTTTGAPQATTPPQMSGTPQVGQTLSALVGTWSGSPTSFSFQWRRCTAAGSCTVIPGANEPQYTPTPADIGASLTLVVSATGPGGTGSVASSPTAAVAPAPAPAPAQGSATAQAGAAGAVTTARGTATASWQPGAVPAGATVTLADRSARRALAHTAVALGIAPLQGALPYPIDVAYAAAPPDAVPGFSTDGTAFVPVSAVAAAPTLPAKAQLGAYRDAGGVLHVLVRTPGVVALFAPNAWGDPRLVSTGAPTLKRIAGSGPIRPRRRADGTALLLTRLRLDSQAHLYAQLLGPHGTRVRMLRTGSRLDTWLHGGATKTVQALARKPGAFPVRLRVSTKRLEPGAYRLRIAAVDPYGRTTQLLLPVRVS